MDPPEPETVWQMIASAAASITAAALAVLGIQYKRYVRDRKTLLRLDRKMGEIDLIRDKTDDGRTPLAMLERLSERVGAMATALETVITRQDDSETRINEMAMSVGKTEVNVEWIKTHLEAGPPRR